MTDILEQQPYLFPLFFAGVWLVVTTVLALMAGWFSLQSQYPDQPEAPTRRWSMASGRLGLTSYSGCMVLSACPSGLRIGVWRVFGPFCHSIFVPWSDLSVERRGWSTRLVIGRAGTGDEPIGQLSLSDTLVSEIARSAGKSWPQGGVIATEPSAKQMAARLLAQWAFISVVGSLFFTLVPRVLRPGAAAPPLVVAIGLPTLFFGAVCVVQFLAYLARRPKRDAR